MDIKLLAKIRIILGALLGLLLLAVVLSARAQSGSCPTNSYLLGLPGGWWPSTVNACAYDQLDVYIVDDSDGNYPCTQYLAVDDATLLDNDRDEPGYGTSAVILPAAATYYGSLAYVRFMLFARPTTPLTGLIPPGHQLAGDSVRIEYHSQAGNLDEYTERPLSDYTVVSTWYDDALGVNHYYQVYMIEQAIYTSDGAGGWFSVRVLYNDGLAFPNRRNYGITSVRIGAYNDAMPDHCPIPNANLPATPPPATPTGTIPATWTPHVTATPIITPGVTAPGITPLPQATTTPFIFPTIEAEYTPTPWPPYDMPTVEWPTRDLLVVAAAATAISQTTGLQGLGDSISAAWETPAAFSGGAMDTSITTTTGYGAPVTLVMSVTQNIALPISYAKSVSGYMPNAAPFLGALLAMAVFMVFNYIAKYAIQVVVFIFELIRKIWEAIPLN